MAVKSRGVHSIIFSLGACLGAWLGSAVAGETAQRGGWRAAFLVLGLPGLALAALVWLTVREPLRGAQDQTRSSARGLKETLRFMRTQRSALHLVLGGSVATLWSWGVLWWTPAFLARSHHLTVAEAGNLLGPMHLVAGIGGTLLAAWLTSLKAARDPTNVALTMAVVVAFSTIPSIFAYWTNSLALATACLWAFVPGVYFFIGPVLGLLQNVLPPPMRATGVAILLFLANIGNLIIAPQLIGWMSDWFRLHTEAGSESLRWAILILAPTGFWGAWHFWRAGRTLRDDEARIAG
jgi:MFS family permease